MNEPLYCSGAVRQAPVRLSLQSNFAAPRVVYRHADTSQGSISAVDSVKKIYIYIYLTAREARTPSPKGHLCTDAY